LGEAGSGKVGWSVACAEGDGDGRVGRLGEQSWGAQGGEVDVGRGIVGEDGIISCVSVHLDDDLLYSRGRANLVRLAASLSATWSTSSHESLARPSSVAAKSATVLSATALSLECLA